MTISRLVVELSAKTAEYQRQMDQAVKITRDTQRQMETSARAVTLLEDRLGLLRVAFRTGQASEAQYAAGLRELQADIAELANKANLSAASMDRLAKVGQRVTGDLNRVTAIAKRTASGFEAFGVAALAGATLAQGGIAGVAAAMQHLQVFAIGHPMLIGILAGVAALGAAFALFGRGAEEDATRVGNAWSAALQFVRAVGEQSTRNRIADLEARQRALTPGPLRTALGLAVGSVAPALSETLIGNPARQAAALADEIERLNRALAITRNDPLRNSRSGGGRDEDLGWLMPDMTGIPLAIQQTDQFIAAMERMKAARDSLMGKEGFLDADIVKDSMGGALESFKTFDKGAMEISVDIAGALSTVAASIAGGFKGIANAILGVVGSFMVSLGKAIIATAIGIIALKNIVRANPLASIAAGVALVAAGSALSSAANRSAQSTFGGGGGGAVASASASSGGSSSGRGEGTQTVIINLGQRRGNFTWEQVDELMQVLGDGVPRRVIPRWSTDG